MKESTPDFGGRLSYLILRTFSVFKILCNAWRAQKSHTHTQNSNNLTLNIHLHPHISENLILTIEFDIEIGRLIFIGLDHFIFGTLKI